MTINHENHFYKLVVASKDKKLSFVENGESMPVTYSGKNTCPDSCPFKGKECYASATYTTNKTFERLTPDTYTRSKSPEYGGTFSEMLKEYSRRIKNRMVRGQVTGDKPSEEHDEDTLDLDACAKLSKISVKNNNRYYDYSHKKNIPSKVWLKQFLSYLNENFCINFSANTVKEAIGYFKLGIPTTVVMENPPNAFSQDGVKFLKCPNQINSEKVRCSNCTLCAQHDRKYVIVFDKH